MRWALSVAVDSRRYEWSASGMNEQIFDLTGGKSLILLDFVGASLFGTPLQIPFQGILRFAKALHPSHFGLRPSCYTKSAIFSFAPF